MQTLTIGREPTNQIVLNHNFVSRRHAQLIILDNGKVMLKDLGSTNGTFVNGNKITEAYLKTGDIVKCGDSFVNWTQYVTGKTMIRPPEAYTKSENEPLYEYPEPQESEIPSTMRFSLGNTIRYLTTRIFDIGDLFKTDWNRTPSILFFLLLPLGIFLCFLLYAYSKIEHEFGYVVITPLIGFFLIFGVSQFCTVGILSLGKAVPAKKILFSSSIFSFLQFLPILIYALYAIPVLFSGPAMFSDYHFSGHQDNIFLNYIAIIFGISILISIFITLIIYIYQYFRSVGVSKGLSLHFVVISFALNLIFQALLIYLFFEIVKDNIDIPFFAPRHYNFY